MKIKNLYKRIICLTVFLISLSALSEAQIMSDYTAYPPSVLTDSPANLMLMIDNSGSMVDLQYLYNPVTDPYCYDSSYDDTATYSGYFEEDAVYQWQSASGTYGKKGAAISSACLHTTAYLCVDIAAGLVTTFEASGKFLNWLSASRLDVLKKILTGGKYDAVNGYIEAESRGCTGRRHIKAVPGINITFGVRGYVNDPNDLLQVASGGNTVIEIFDGSFDPTPCQDAAALIDSSQGQFKGAVDDCLALGKLDDGTKEKIKGERSTFNHTIHGCYKKRKGDAIPVGTITSTKISCEKVYDTTLPGDIQSYEPSYICSDRRKACTGSDPAYICNDDTDCTVGTCQFQDPALSGFFGECYVEANSKVNAWSKNGVCEETQMEAFCDNLKIPQIIDPTISTADLTDQLYLPAFLIDSGLFAQTGYPIGQFPVKIETSSAPTGLIDAFQSDIRFGVMRFNYCGAGTENLTNTNIVNDCQDPDDPAATDKDGGTVVSYIGDADTSQAINNIKTATWTPFSEAFYNIIAYYVSDADVNLTDDTTQFDPTTEAIQEPLNPGDDFAAGKNPIQFRCQKNNILIISDGASTADINKKMTDKITLDSPLFDDGDAGDAGTCGDYSGSTYLDDLSYYAKNRNIFNPSDINPADDEVAQHITSYVVYVGEDTVTPDECDGVTLMDNTARNGGTSLYNPTDPTQLGKTLRNALLEISGDVASGSSASVLSSSTTGEGAVYHSQYHPKKRENLETRSWLGYMQSLFIDSYGNLREDSDNDDTLDSSDSILKMEYTIEDGTKIKKCSYTDTEGNYSCSNQIYTYEEINPVWAGGKLLWQRDPDTREIFTSIDGYSREEFVATNNVALKPFLREDDDAVAAKVINWIRGRDFTHPVDDIDATHPNGYRKRDITIGASSNIWKLGDIVHSAPTLVGRPMENFDLLYGDASYSKFWLEHKNRLRVTYIGANDGMLHAFNAGCYDAVGRSFYSDVNGSGECFNGTHTLGEELWAFIPRGLLPHLQWLTDPEYTHVYYVDSKPKVSDVKIFDDDATNVGGWGTILIGGMRFGGNDIDWTHAATDYSASPEYFALDITDPLNPRLLWTFSDPDLGLSMSYPSVAKIGASWYAIFGSGATDFDEESNFTNYQNGNIFVLKISGGNDGVINTWTKDSNFWKLSTGGLNTYLADSITIDVDLNNSVDVMYIGENDPNNDNALLKRITTSRGSETDPNQWDISTIANITSIGAAKDEAKRITAAPAAAMDSSANLWIYFGSGQFVGLKDRNPDDTGAFYGIKDKCWKGDCDQEYSALLDISKAEVKTDGTVSGVSGACGGAISNWSNLLNGSNNCDGWALYFGERGTGGESTDYTGTALKYKGEKMFTKPFILGGLVTWTTFIPGIDECTKDGESNVYAVYYETGTAYKKHVFSDQVTTDPIGRVKNIGKGMASTVSGQETKDGKTKGIIKQSNGTIIEIENNAPVSRKSKVMGWSRKPIP